MLNVERMSNRPFFPLHTHNAELLLLMRMLWAFGERLKYHPSTLKPKRQRAEKFRRLFNFFFFLFRSHPLAAETDLPDPVTNCTAYNATAYTMQFTCVPGNDGGIKQSFFVEVINFDARNFFFRC